jgi:hypothetical protein
LKIKADLNPIKGQSDQRIALAERVRAPAKWVPRITSKYVCVSS